MSADNNETNIRIVAGQRENADVSRRFPADCKAIMDWLYDYISEPHAGVGRSGPVCPFVPPSLRDGHLHFSIRYDHESADPERLVQVLLDEMREFDECTPPLPSNGIQLHSRLVSFPLFESGDWARLDKIYDEALKDTAVGQGLMIGQFHPDCTVPAVRNSGFPVSRSPHAMVAMRRMAPHDILFLHEDRRWFALYQDRFGSRHDRGLVRDPLMQEFYSAALATHHTPI